MPPVFKSKPVSDTIVTGNLSEARQEFIILFSMDEKDWWHEYYQKKGAKVTIRYGANAVAKKASISFLCCTLLPVATELVGPRPA